MSGSTLRQIMRERIPHVSPACCNRASMLAYLRIKVSLRTLTPDLFRSAFRTHMCVSDDNQRGVGMLKRLRGRKKGMAY